MKSTSELPPSAFVQVWAPDGTGYRFAAGTKAGFAVDRINSRLSESICCIEAVKKGELPVEFGPDAELVNYGEDWVLCTVQADPKFSQKQHTDPSRNQRSIPKPVDLSSLYLGGKLPRGRKPEFTLEYIGKIALCFVFMLLLGTILTLFLEQLPTFLGSQPSVRNDNHEL